MAGGWLGAGVADPTPSTFSLPPWICGSTAGSASNITSMRPLITCGCASDAPLNGTWTIDTPVCARKASVVRCDVEPLPADA